MVGLALLVGGMRYHEQTYNFFGANAFLAVIVPLAGARPRPAKFHAFVARADPLRAPTPCS